MWRNGVRFQLGKGAWNCEGRSLAALDEKSVARNSRATRGLPLRSGEGSSMTGGTCFIDTMRSIAPDERLGWEAFLRLPAEHWKAGRTLFSHPHAGCDVGTNLLQFVSQTGVKDMETIALLKAALTALGKEREA